MKCTNLIQQDNKNSDDDNQDSKTKKKIRIQTRVLFVLFSILANEMIMKNEQDDHQHR